MASPNGQYMFTESQRLVIKDRIQNGTPNVFGGASVFMNDVNSFIANPSANRYTFLGSETPINADTCYLPVPFNSGCSNVWSTNIYQAAIYAWALDNATVAQQVIDQVVLRSNDTKLDFSNTARFQRGYFAPTDVPYFYIIAWMSRMLDCYTLLDDRGLITLTTTERNRLDQWFEDCKDWDYSIVDHNYKQYWGDSWQSDVFSVNSLANVALPDSDGNSTYSNPPFKISDGNGGFVYPNGYLQTKLQPWTMAASRWRYGNYLMRYGCAYNDSACREMSFEVNKMYLEFAVWPDGTNIDANRILRTQLWKATHNYIIGAIAQLLTTAYIFKVAKVNGLAGMEAFTGNEVYDFTTSSGFSSYPSLSGYVGGDTAGGQKNIKLVMDAYLKWFKQSHGDGSGGWNPPRYSPFSSDNVLIGNHGANDRNFISVYAFANSYYDDPVFKNVYEQDEPNMPSKLTYGDGMMTNWAAFNSTSGFHGAFVNVDIFYANNDGILGGVSEIIDNILPKKRSNLITYLNT